MTETTRSEAAHKTVHLESQSGFGVAEFLMSALIVLGLTLSVFGLLRDVQRSAGYQTEVQSVLDNTRLAMQTVGRYLRQAGNDPFGCGQSGITIISPTEVKITADLTGSAAPGTPDKGDPDGDIADSGENITIRYNKATRSLEAVTDSGAVQVVAGYISDLSLQYLDSAGAPATGTDVRKVNVTISGTSQLRDPTNGRKFGIRLSSDFEIAT